MVEAIVGALAATGVLDNTYVLYTSDNGFQHGRAPAAAGQEHPYEEDIRVPVVMRGPGVPGARASTRMALNIDLAPTFAEIAGIEPPGFVDGRSFLPLLDDPERPGGRAS